MSALAIPMFIGRFKLGGDEGGAGGGDREDGGEGSGEAMKMAGGTIPVCRHIVTDDQIVSDPAAEPRPINFEKIIAFLEDPNTALRFDLQGKALRKVVKHHPHGFLFKDLGHVRKVLSIVGNSIENDAGYEKWMMELLQLCASPFLGEKASDERNFETTCIEFVSFLGSLLRISRDQVRLQVCRTIRSLYDTKSTQACIQLLKPASSEYMRRVIEKSEAFESFVQYLANVDQEWRVSTELLDLLAHLSATSSRNCDRMLEADAAYVISCRLDVEEGAKSGGAPLRAKGVFFKSVEILWNLLETSGNQAATKAAVATMATAADQLSNDESISRLRDAFLHQVSQGFSDYDRQIRNDLLMISLLVAEASPMAPFVETGFAKYVVAFATFQEVKSRSALVRHFRLNTNPEDFQLKKLLFHFIVVLSRNFAIWPTDPPSILSGTKLRFGLQPFFRTRRLNRDEVDAEIDVVGTNAASIPALNPGSSKLPPGVQLTRRLVEWSRGSAADKDGVLEAFPGELSFTDMTENEAMTVAKCRLEHSLLRKVSRVFCECRRHRCEGLHWTPENGEEQEAEEEKGDEPERKPGNGGRAIYEPPVAHDFVSEDDDEIPPPVLCECRSLLGAASSSPDGASKVKTSEIFRFCFGRDFRPELRLSLEHRLNFEQKARGAPHFYQQDGATGRNDAVAETKRLSFFPVFEKEKSGAAEEKRKEKGGPPDGGAQWTEASSSEAQLLADLGFDPWATQAEERRQEEEAAAAEAAALGISPSQLKLSIHVSPPQEIQWIDEVATESSAKDPHATPVAALPSQPFPVSWHSNLRLVPATASASVAAAALCDVSKAAAAAAVSATDAVKFVSNIQLEDFGEMLSLFAGDVVKEMSLEKEFGELRDYADEDDADDDGDADGGGRKTARKQGNAGEGEFGRLKMHESGGGGDCFGGGGGVGGGEGEIQGGSDEEESEGGILVGRFGKMSGRRPIGVRAKNAAPREESGPTAETPKKSMQSMTSGQKSQKSQKSQSSRASGKKSMVSGASKTVEEEMRMRRRRERQVIRNAEARRLWWQIVSEGQVLLALFSYIEVGVEKKRKVKKDSISWSSAQFEELQLQALVSLQTLAPLCIGDYTRLHGNTRLLLLFDWCLSADPFFGHGNSLYANGGRGNKRAQLRHLLRVLRNMVALRAGDMPTTATPAEATLMKQDLVDQGVIPQLVETLRRFSFGFGVKGVGGEGGSGPGDEIDIDIQCDMLHILALLSKDDLCRKVIFSACGGVEMLTTYFTSATLDPASYLAIHSGQHRLILALLDGVWSCVVGVEVGENRFLEAEGIFLLLDLLQEAPPSLRAPVLGVLVDSCERPEVIPHLTSWRGGDAGHPLSKLLCQIWREEEASMGVVRDKYGSIGDPAAPLAGAGQRLRQKSTGASCVYPPPPALPGSAPSAAILDAAENVRAKIFVLLSKMGFGTDVDHPLITVEDRVTLTIIAHYLEFKMAEVWTEVDEELRKEGVDSICGEKEAADSILTGADQLVTRVGEEARAIVERDAAVEAGLEASHYRWIGGNHRQADNAEKRRQRLVERTSNHSKLVRAKKLQDDLVDVSRIRQPYREGDTFHETAIKDTNVTAFVGRHAFIDARHASLTKIGKKKSATKSKSN